MKVLIVDDDPIALAVLQNAVVSFGFECLIATNGKTALELVRAEAPNMVISDVNMPEMNGDELCRQIRSRSSVHYTYIILLTSLSDSRSIVSGLDAGADDYLAKPVRPDELRLRIEGGRRVLALESRDLMIFALAKLAESRDSDTGKHLERIREYSQLLASTLASHPDFSDKIDQQFIDLLYMTSPLHDVGKVGIPDSVLLKPGRLTADEFEVMKQHTVIGAETLKATAASHPEASFLKMALDITLGHHERWDGTGYPSGVAGEDIPLSARIVAVADVYDALTTNRVYKDAYSHEKAARIIIDSKGSHFDPRCVDAFIQVESEMDAIRTALDDEPSDQTHEVPPPNLPKKTAEGTSSAPTL